ncbi:MAG: hypothetical protein JWN78_946 [Bacteroidota bacterium]|nr:hypothetical protein [Bacteroidota bacterium]
MIRIKTLVLSFFISSFAFSENEIDRKVEQLFFHTDISNVSLSLIDSLADVKTITYEKPTGYTVNFMMGGMLGVTTHLFEFKSTPELPVSFEKGVIKVLVNGNDTYVNDVSLELQVEKKEDGFKAFEELKDFLFTPDSRAYHYKTRNFLAEEEFYNKTSKKYHQVSLMLTDNDNPEGKYKILMSVR